MDGEEKGSPHTVVNGLEAEYNVEGAAVAVDARRSLGLLRKN